MDAPHPNGEAVRLTFLGTGTSQGVPVIACDCEVCQSQDPRDTRFRAAVLLQTQGRTLVVDTGPDFRSQMLANGVTALDGVLITHKHKDHVAGLDDVRAFNFRQKRPMPVFADQLTVDHLKVEFAYVFDQNPYPGVPRLDVHVIDDQPFAAAGVAVTPIPVWHYKMPVMGFRVGDVAYVTDASEIPPTSMERLQGLDVLVLNALRLDKHISHFNLEEALEVVATLQPRRAYFTHLSHLMGTHAATLPKLPPNVHLAHDGLVVTGHPVPTRG